MFVIALPLQYVVSACLLHHSSESCSGRHSMGVAHGLGIGLE